MNTSAQSWRPIELVFESTKLYQNPYTQGGVTALFTSPDGTEIRARGYFDGGKRWVVRFAPSSPGTFRFETISDDRDDTGLDGNQGSFAVEPYRGDNPIMNHGHLRVTDDLRGFCHADMTPFFWLGDTAWAVASRASLDEWREYIQLRSKQGFNLIQVNSLPQHDSSTGGPSRSPFRRIGSEFCFDQISVEYFQYLDRLVEEAHSSGVIVALVAFWLDYVPGTSWRGDSRGDLTLELARRYGEYLAARYSAYGTVWLVSGDSDFSDEKAIATYDATARGIVSASPYSPLLTCHLHGGICTPPELNRMDWLAFHMYQTSHTPDTAEKTSKYSDITRAYSPVRPVINGEPCYENMGYYRSDGRFSREVVREVAWRSILSGATAGLTYGAHGIWSWHRKGDTFKNEDEWQLPSTWREALGFQGGDDCIVMKEFLMEYPWWKLQPVRSLPERFGERCKVAASLPDGSLTLAYFRGPVVEEITLEGSEQETVSWMDPVTGDIRDAVFRSDGGALDGCPFADDAVLVIERF